MAPPTSKNKKRPLVSGNTGEPKAKKNSRAGDNDEEDVLKYVPDVFNRSTLLDEDTAVCVMCKGKTEEGRTLKQHFDKYSNEILEESDSFLEGQEQSIGDINGIWASKYSLGTGNNRIFIHWCCAISSPQAHYDGSKWYNLSREVTRSRGLTCRTCGVGGATVGCEQSGCHAVFHVPCAARLGFTRVGRIRFFCDPHRQARIESRKIKQLPMVYDFSNGLEPITVEVENELDAHAIHVDKRYSTSVVGSTDVRPNMNRAQGMDCCDCTDLCDDQEGCPCLSIGRNYTYEETLLPQMNHKLRECNPKCACHFRSCTNRVVQRGIKYRLQIFRVPLMPLVGGKGSKGAGGGKTKEHTWGVRTLDFIPANSFVCEITGQYQYGKSKVYHKDVNQNILGGESMTDLLLDMSDALQQKQPEPQVKPHVKAALQHLGVVPMYSWESGEHISSDRTNLTYYSSEEDDEECGEPEDHNGGRHVPFKKRKERGASGYMSTFTATFTATSSAAIEPVFHPENNVLGEKLIVTLPDVAASKGTAALPISVYSSSSATMSAAMVPPSVVSAAQAAASKSVTSPAAVATKKPFEIIFIDSDSEDDLHEADTPIKRAPPPRAPPATFSPSQTITKTLSAAVSSIGAMIGWQKPPQEVISVSSSSVQSLSVSAPHAMVGGSATTNGAPVVTPNESEQSLVLTATKSATLASVVSSASLPSLATTVKTSSTKVSSALKHVCFPPAMLKVPREWAEEKIREQQKKEYPRDGTSEEMAATSIDTAAVRSLLDGELCLDCRSYGNIGTFIRRRNTPEQSKMLIRKLVYLQDPERAFTRAEDMVSEDFERQPARLDANEHTGHYSDRIVESEEPLDPAELAVRAVADAATAAAAIYASLHDDDDEEEGVDMWDPEQKKADDRMRKSFLGASEIFVDGEDADTSILAMRKVYRERRFFPKLALFAACDIQPGSEIFL